MGADFTKNMENFLDQSKAKKFQENRADIQKMVSSSDGEKVSSILNEYGAADALQRGDAAALKNVFENILKTDEGYRLCQQLSDLLK